MIELSYSPKHWCASKLVFIPKPFKDLSEAKGYRPISLMTFFIKTVEKLCLWEIEQTALKAKPLSIAQNAFRKGFSTESAISSLVDSLESLILRDKYALAVFLDVEGAFNNVSYKSIIKAMYDRNISSKIVKWYDNFLLNRTATVDYKGITHTVSITKGCAQGGILSPLAWNLVFESFIELYKHTAIKIGAFADDSCLHAGSIDICTLKDIMQEALNKATEWSTKEGLNFVPSKSYAVLFHRKKQVTLPEKLKLNGIPIEYVKETKYLGVTLDFRLSWKTHINLKIKNAKRQIMRVKNAIGSVFGPSPKMLSWAYKGIIIPSLGYGSIVWSRITENGGIRRKLSSLNRLMALCMAPLRRSTPTAGLEVVLNLPPLDIKIKEMALSAMLRILPSRKMIWDGLGHKGRGHQLWGSNNLKEIKISDMNFDSTNILHLKKNYTVDMKSLHCGKPISDSSIDCYTDGSKLEGQAGFGFSIYQNNINIENDNGFIGKNQTVFQAEVLGIQKAAERLMNHNAKSITFFSDSQSAISALAGWKIRSKTVSNCIETLNALGRDRNVTIKWIRAHVGWQGNEMADENAKKGTKNVSNWVKTPQPVSWAKLLIRQAAYQQWRTLWYTTKSCRQTKIWFPSIDIKSSKLLINLPRMELGLAVQMFTGHNRLSRHENLCNQEVSPLCRLCKEETETSWHLIGCCPLLYSKRWQVFNTPFLAEPPEWKVYQFLDFLHLAKLSELNKREDLAQSQV